MSMPIGICGGSYYDVEPDAIGDHCKRWNSIGMLRREPAFEEMVCLLVLRLQVWEQSMHLSKALGLRRRL
jgi:hypothetical protein